MRRGKYTRKIDVIPPTLSKGHEPLSFILFCQEGNVSLTTSDCIMSKWCEMKNHAAIAVMVPVKTCGEKWEKPLTLREWPTPFLP